MGRGEWARCRITLCDQSLYYTGRAPWIQFPFPVILGLDPWINEWFCEYVWMPDQIRHDFPAVKSYLPPITDLFFPFEF